MQSEMEKTRALGEARILWLFPGGLSLVLAVQGSWDFTACGTWGQSLRLREQPEKEEANPREDGSNKEGSPQNLPINSLQGFAQHPKLWLHRRGAEPSRRHSWRRYKAERRPSPAGEAVEFSPDVGRGWHSPWASLETSEGLCLRRRDHVLGLQADLSPPTLTTSKTSLRVISQDFNTEFSEDDRN